MNNKPLDPEKKLNPQLVREIEKDFFRECTYQFPEKNISPNFCDLQEAPSVDITLYNKPKAEKLENRFSDLDVAREMGKGIANDIESFAAGFATGTYNFTKNFLKGCYFAPTALINDFNAGTFCGAFGGGGINFVNMMLYGIGRLSNDPSFIPDKILDIMGMFVLAYFSTNTASGVYEYAKCKYHESKRKLEIKKFEIE